MRCGTSYAGDHAASRRPTGNATLLSGTLSSLNELTVPEFRPLRPIHATSRRSDRHLCLVLVVVLVTAAGALGSAGWARTTERSASVHSTTLEKYEYVFVDQNIVIYRIGGGYRRVASIPLHQMQGIRGVAGNARTHLLYVSYGPDTDAGQGHLLAYDLVAAHVAWDRDYSFGIDSMAISPDGTRIYMPTGELSNGSAWNVLNARDGDVIGTISGGRGPHNTIVGPSGRRVYLGPRQDNYLYVASTATNRIVRKVGPLINTVRPFTINGSET